MKSNLQTNIKFLKKNPPKLIVRYFQNFCKFEKGFGQRKKIGQKIELFISFNSRNITSMNMSEIDAVKRTRDMNRTRVFGQACLRASWGPWKSDGTR